jgi:NADH:ubiquinone oxidoreductase subunit K
MLFWEPIFWNNNTYLLYTLTYDFIYLFDLCLLSLIILSIGFLGLLLGTSSIIHILLALELILLGFNLLSIFFILYFNNPQGYLLIFILLTLAGTESAIGFSIIILYYRLQKQIMLDCFLKLRY